eukprot:3317848-Rhodomonas_salina.1
MLQERVADKIVNGQHINYRVRYAACVDGEIAGLQAGIRRMESQLQAAGGAAVDSQTEDQGAGPATTETQGKQKQDGSAAGAGPATT